MHTNNRFGASNYVIFIRRNVMKNREERTSQ